MVAVRYIVSDVDASVSFYTTHLGFNLDTQFGPAMAIVVREDLRLWLAGSSSFAAKPMPDGRQPEPGGWNRIVIEVEDIDAAVATLKASGANFRNQVVEGRGGKQILLEDPSGNPIELFQPGLNIALFPTNFLHPHRLGARFRHVARHSPYAIAGSACIRHRNPDNHRLPSAHEPVFAVVASWSGDTSRIG